MLKKNLVKTGIFGHALLCLVPNATAVKGEPINPKREIVAVRQQVPLHASDSLTLPEKK
jgi:hypothetical protein